MNPTWKIDFLSEISPITIKLSSIDNNSIVKKFIDQPTDNKVNNYSVFLLLKLFDFIKNINASGIYEENKRKETFSPKRVDIRLYLIHK